MKLPLEIKLIITIRKIRDKLYSKSQNFLNYQISTKYAKKYALSHAQVLLHIFMCKKYM